MYPQSLVCLACLPEITFWKVITDVHWDWLFEPVDELSEDDELSDDDELSEELLEQESIKPKANTKIVGKKRNFSFFI